MSEAVAALIGALIGGSLPAIFGHFFGRTKDLRDQKREAYLHFVKAVSSLAQDCNSGAALLEANLAIVISGCGDVVRKVDEMMQFEKLDSYEAHAAFAAAVIEMRKDLGMPTFGSDNATIRGIVFRKPIL